MKNETCMLLEEIRKARSHLLDLIELASLDRRKFYLLRSRVMAVFGEQGLEGTVKKIKMLGERGGK